MNTTAGSCIKSCNLQRKPVAKINLNRETSRLKCEDIGAFPYRIQSFQKLIAVDKLLPVEYYTRFLTMQHEDEKFRTNVLFSDKSSFIIIHIFWIRKTTSISKNLKSVQQAIL